MNNLYQKRFQLQLLFALIAAVSVAALAVDLVVNAVRHAESYVLSDTGTALHHALAELKGQYRLRAQDGTNWSELSQEAQNLTLQGISQTVLASYPGVEGGFWAKSQFAGYAYPTHDSGAPKTDVPAAEKADIEAAISLAQASGKGEQVLRGKRDLVVIEAETSEDSVVWAMKRLPGQADTAQRSERLLLVILIGAALLSAAGVLATGFGLTRGISQITAGLAGIEREGSQDLPTRRDELGRISAAINEMVHARRRLEAEVRREDRMRTIGHLVGRIAHEMRNPLNSMRLSLQMLGERHEQDRLRGEDFSIVIHEVDRVNGLLSDLLAFEQPRPPKLEVCALAPLLEECRSAVNSHSNENNVNISVDPTGETALVDRQYFHQIMINLLLNAIQVSRPGEQIQIKTLRRNERVSVEVSDTGPGLTPEQEEHVFEPFYTTKPSGHGLGLSVSRELARSMSAELSWRHGSGKGATFILNLKVSA